MVEFKPNQLVRIKRDSRYALVKAGALGVVTAFRTGHLIDVYFFRDGDHGGSLCRGGHWIEESDLEPWGGELIQEDVNILRLRGDGSQGFDATEVCGVYTND